MSSDDLLMSSDCLLMSSIGAEMAQVLRAYDDQTRDGKLQLSEFSVLIRDLDRGIIREQALSDEVIRRHSSLDPQQHPQGSDARLPSTLDQSSSGAHQELIRSSSTLDQSSILRWSAQRREEEAAQLRTLERSLRDEALAEQLLSEQASLMASDCLPPHMMLLSEQGEFATEGH